MCCSFWFIFKTQQPILYISLCRAILPTYAGQPLDRIPGPTNALHAASDHGSHIFFLLLLSSYFTVADQRPTSQAEGGGHRRRRRRRRRRQQQRRRQRSQWLSGDVHILQTGRRGKTGTEVILERRKTPRYVHPRNSWKHLERVLMSKMNMYVLPCAAMSLRLTINCNVENTSVPAPGQRYGFRRRRLLQLLQLRG